MSNNGIHKKVWTLLILTWIVQAITQLQGMSWGMMTPSIMEELGIAYDVIGSIAGTASLLCVILTIPVGIFIVKLPTKYTQPLVFILIGLGYLLCGLSESTGALYVGKILANGLVQLIAAALAVVKAANVPQDRITSVNGKENFVGPIGQLLGTMFITNIMALVGGWRRVYLICAVILFVIAIIYFVVYGKGDGINVPAAPAKDPNAPKQPSALLEAWKKKEVWALGIAWPGQTVAWIAMFYYFPSLAQKEIGLSSTMSGIVLAMIPIFSAVGSLVAPKLTSKLGRDKPIIVLGGLGQTVFYLLMLNAPNVPLLLLFTACAGFCGYVTCPPAFSVIYKLGLSVRGTSMAYSTLMTFLAFGQFIGGTVVGALVQNMGLSHGLFIAALTPLWFTVLALIFVPELGRKKMEAMMAAKAKQQ